MLRRLIICHCFGPISLLLGLVALGMPTRAAICQETAQADAQQEVLLASTPQEAPRLTEPQDWKLVEGTMVSGPLVQWLGADEMIYIDARGIGLQPFPLRQFIADDQARILEALGPWREDVLRLYSLEPIRHPTGKDWMQGDRPLPHWMLLGIQDDVTLWQPGTPSGFRSIPLSAFTAEQRQQIQDRVAQRDQLPRWQTVVPGCRFAAKLEGKVEDAYVFSGLWTHLNLTPSPVHFGLRAHLLNTDDRQRADAMIASQDVAPPMPDLWCWPGEQMLFGPGKPQSIEGDQLYSLVPHHQAERANDPAQRRQRGDSLVFFSPVGELEVRLLLAEADLRAESPSLSEQQITETLQTKRAEFINQRPLHYLAQTRHWRLRDTSSPIEAMLAGEIGDYYVMLWGPDKLPVAALKSEFSEASAAAAQTTLQRLEEYFASHPDAERPQLETRIRWVRCLDHPRTTQPLEPVEIKGPDGYRMFFFRGPDGTAQGGVRVRETNIHWIDAQELLLVISGATLEDSQTDPTAPGEAVVAGGREQKLQAMQLQQYLEQPPSWGFTPVKIIVPGQGVLAYRAAVIGRHQDSLIMRRDGFDFLVDADLLTADARTGAEEQLQHFQELIRGTDFNVAVPTARLWSGANQVIGPGTAPKLLENGAFEFTKADGRRESITASDLGASVTIELKIQLAADAQVRSSSGTDRSLEEIQAFKEKLRARLTKEQRQTDWLQARVAWAPLESQGQITATFDRFDGDDVILRGLNGKHFRVYQFAFDERTRARMEQLTKDYQADGKPGLVDDLDVTTVTDRFFRGRGSQASVRGTLISATHDALIVSTGGGATVQVPVSQLHHRDVSEARSRWYGQRHALIPDTQINDRLRQPIASSEVIHELPPLDAALQQRMETLNQQQQRVWTEQPLELRADELVVGIAVDGSRCIVAGPTVRILGQQGETIGEFPIKLDREAPAFLADQHRKLAGFVDGKLTLWDLAQPDKLRSLGDIQQPAAATQSADGKHIVLATASGSLWIVQPEDGIGRGTGLNLEPDESLQAQVWCSQDGARFAIASPKNLYLMKFDHDSGRVTPEAKMPLLRPVTTLAASPAGFYVTHSTDTSVMAFEITDGRMSSSAREIGMSPRWYGAELGDGKFWFRSMGVPVGGTSSAPYAFVVTRNLRGQLAGSAEIIEHDLSGPAHIARSGNAVVFLRGDRWIFATPPPAFSRDAILSSLAGELVDGQRLDQLDAVWKHLRGESFAALGDYPDHVSELFLEHLRIAIQNYQWQHGGDLQERGELLLRRWSERAPQSAVVAVLRGVYHHGLAWDARGSGFANTVGKTRFEIFNEQMRLCVQAIKPALEQEHPSTRAFMLVFDAAMSLNQPLETVKRFHSQMMETPAQWSPPAHTAVVLYLLPRWHGGPGDSERYISAVADRLGGDRGDAMYTHLMLYVAQFYPRNEPASNHLDIDLNRVLKGLSGAVGVTSPKPAVMRQAIELFQREQRDDLVEKAQQVAVEQRIYYAE